MESKETLKTLIDTSKEKTKKFEDATEKAKEEQKALILSAWGKVFEYLKGIKDLGFRGTVELHGMNLYWLNNGKDERAKDTRFSFSNTELEIYESACASTLKLKFAWEGDIDNYNLKNPSNDDFAFFVKKLTKRWAEIKPSFEQAMQTVLIDRMNKAEQKLNKVTEANDLLANFVA